VEGGQITQMLERAHRLGPLRLAAILAALLALAGVVAWVLVDDGDSESTPGVAPNPARSGAAEPSPSTTDAVTNDAGANSSDDPNASSKKEAKQPLGNPLPGGGGDRDGSRSRPGLPPEAEELFEGATDEDGDPPKNLPPELERLLGGITSGD
jgi:hypothetical protein